MIPSAVSLSLSLSLSLSPSPSPHTSFNAIRHPSTPSHNSRVDYRIRAHIQCSPDMSLSHTPRVYQSGLHFNSLQKLILSDKLMVRQLTEQHYRQHIVLFSSEGTSIFNLCLVKPKLIKQKLFYITFTQILIIKLLVNALKVSHFIDSIILSMLIFVLINCQFLCETKKIIMIISNNHWFR